MTSDNITSWCVGIGGVVVAVITAIVSWRKGAASDKRDDYGFLFRQQQLTIEALQKQIDALSERHSREMTELRREHISCREENASLRGRVAELERDIAEMKAGK